MPKDGLHLKPHAFVPLDGQNPQAGVIKDKENSADYLLFLTQSHPKLYFTYNDAKYWSAPGRELTKDELKRFLPYLRWDFDESKEIKSGKNEGKVAQVFPPTTENIMAKRKELFEKSILDGKTPDMEAIKAATQPRQLLERKALQDYLDDYGMDPQTIKRLANSRGH